MYAIVYIYSVQKMFHFNFDSIIVLSLAWRCLYYLLLDSYVAFVFKSFWRTAIFQTYGNGERKSLINVVFHLSLHSVVCRRRPEKEVDLIILPRENCTSSTATLPNSTEAIQKDSVMPTLNDGSKQPLITHSNIRSDSQYDKNRY